MTAALPITVYDGLRRLGEAVDVGGRWRAVDAAGGALGEFGKQGAAVDAVLAAARYQDGAGCARRRSAA